MYDKLKSEEGAGLTEFAIMTVMLVPIVMVGVYASESMSTALKVREAEVSSAWAATGYRLHNYRAAGGTDDRFDSVGRMVAQRTRADLQDFDSAQSLANQGTHMVVTDAELSRLKCSVSNPMSVTRVGYGRSYLDAGGWLSCKAHASLDADRIPTYNSVGEMRQFSNYGVLLQKLRSINLQGMGSNGMVVLANDWALENPNPAGNGNRIADASHPGNPQYFNAGSAVFASALPSNYPDNIVQRAMSHLLGANDMGNTDGYKLGYQERVSDERMVPTIDGTRVRTHLTPRWKDLKNDYFKRDNDYLGSANPYEMGNSNR